MKIQQAKFVGSFPSYELAPQNKLPEIAVGGRSNVGKSSLINSLLGQRKLAQISKSPGKTRLLNYFTVVGQGGKELLHFVDLPGFGYARVGVSERNSWQKMIESYVENSDKLKGFILLIDARRGPENEETQLIEYLLLHNKTVCPIFTKTDKLTRQDNIIMAREANEIFRAFGDKVGQPILHSSIKKTGNDLIWHWILERIGDESK
jgi:GTP-binding protein